MLRPALSLLPAAGRWASGQLCPPGLLKATPAVSLAGQVRHLFANTFVVPREPVNDLAPDSRYSADEAITRCKLASLYRLAHARGWSNGIYKHITARINSNDEEFLVKPFAMLYNEVTASNLVKVNLASDVLDQGSSKAGISLAGYTLHSAIHETRPDILCALHVNLPETVAVATMECGLLPLTQEALLIHATAGVSYHDYQGIVINGCERKNIQESLGDKNKVLILKNHGVVVCGSTVEEAYLLVDFFSLACRSQVALMAAGEENFVQVPSIAFQSVMKMKPEGTSLYTKQAGKPVEFGQQGFEACMRYLDRTGHNTGYPYQYPDIVQQAL